MTELETNAVFSDAGGVTWVVGRRGGDQFIYALPAPDRVFECAFEIVDSWTVGETTYLLPNDQAPVPLFTATAGAFVRAKLPATVARVLGAITAHLAGAGEDLVIAQEGAVITRRKNAWRVVPEVESREPRAVAIHDGDVITSYGFGIEDDRGPQLVRQRGRTRTVIAPKRLPANAIATVLRVTPRGALLVVFQLAGKHHSVWLFDRTWRQVTTTIPVITWDHAAACTHEARVYVATKRGVLVLDETGRRLERSSMFDAMHVWSTVVGVVCRAWKRGKVVHYILRDKRWLAFPIPCPEIVAGTGRAVWMPPKRRVPVQRLRL
jgi:hypothetical protein